MMLKEYRGGFLAVLATCFCFMLPTVVGETVTSLRAFTLHRNFPEGVNRLGQGWVDSDEVSCARSCLRRYQNCITVMFNPSTRLCTPGSTLNVSAPLVSAEEGDLYILDGCPVHGGFTLRTYNGTFACLKLSADNKTYGEAEAACGAFGGFLASFKTKEKQAIVQDMLQGLTTTGLIFVGCNDRVEEGVYEWKEDGETFTNATYPETFGKNEGLMPHANDEDCIGLSLEDGKYILADMPCWWSHQYLCERYVL